MCSQVSQRSTTLRWRNSRSPTDWAVVRSSWQALYRCRCCLDVGTVSPACCWPELCHARCNANNTTAERGSLLHMPHTVRRFRRASSPMRQQQSCTPHQHSLLLQACRVGCWQRDCRRPHREQERHNGVAHSGNRVIGYGTDNVSVRSM